MAAYGWIKRGQKRKLQTNSGRQRLNLHGAINAETLDVTVIESETVNAESTIDLLETLNQKYPLSSRLHIILDNARYHYSRVVKDWLEENGRINLVFLPVYSPELNLIERLWKFFKKSVKVNCHICGESSKLEDKCPICKGSGRYIRRWKQGGGVNLECKRCQGKGKVKINCHECRGKGQLKKAVLSDELKSTTPCKKCRQLGFITKDFPKSQKQKQKHFKKHPPPFQPFPVKARDGKTLADLIKKG